MMQEQNVVESKPRRVKRLVQVKARRFGSAIVLWILGGLGWYAYDPATNFIIFGFSGAVLIVPWIYFCLREKPLEKEVWDIPKEPPLIR
jgi:hypothetical protein